MCPLSLPLCTTNYTLQAPSYEGSVVGWPSSSSGSSREAWGEGISESSNEKWFTNFCCQNVVIYIGASFFCQSLSLMPGKDCGKCSTLIFRLVKRGGVRGVALDTNQLYIRVIPLGVERSWIKECYNGNFEHTQAWTLQALTWCIVKHNKPTTHSILKYKQSYCPWPLPQMLSDFMRIAWKCKICALLFLLLLAVLSALLPLSHFIVTKNKLVETGLQLAKTVKLRKNTVWRATVFVISLSVAMLCPVVSRKFGQTVTFSHSKLSISSTITVAAKMFQAALEFVKCAPSAARLNC